MRGTSGMAAVSINTMTKLLVDVGTACADYQNATLRNLPCKRLQRDEIWSFATPSKRTYRKASRGSEVWRCMDVDRAMRRYHACAVLVYRRP